VSRREERLRRAWQAWIGLLLHAFPTPFRRQMGPELAAQYAADPPRTLGRFIRRAGPAARDLLPAGLGARLDDWKAPPGAARGPFGGGIAADARYGLRMLIRQPVYSGTIVLTLALASGLATAVFGIYDATLVRPLPFPDDRRLVSIGSMWTGFSHASVSIPEYLDYRGQARSFESVAAVRNVSLNFAEGAAGPERLPGAAVTASFFDVLGVAPVLGRVFTAEEDRPGGASVAVLSRGVWQRRFGGAPGVVGRAVRINDQPVTIVGIMPASFRFPEADTGVWIPLRVDSASPGNRGAHNRAVIARIRGDVTLAAVRGEVSAIGRRLAREYPEDYPDGSGWGVSVKTLRERLVGDLTEPLRLLFAAVLFVVLIAAANTSGLMLARASERRAEFAARAALGASRLRVIRQVVIEGAVAGAAGGALGLLVAELLLRGFELTLPAAVSRPGVLALDPRAVAFALGVTAAAAAAAGAYAAIQASRVNAGEALRSGARTTAGRSARRFRAALVVGELALAFVLLTGAGLSIRSFGRLLEADPGIDTSQVATARLSLPAARYATGRDAAAFYGRLLDSIEAAPGVAHAGAVSILPLSGSDSDANFGVEGYLPPTPGEEPNAQARFVAGDYFRALDIPVVRGRLFTDGDDPDAPFVAIVSEALARKFWPGADPVGRRMKMWGLDDEGPWRTIVGVVGDVRHFGLAEDATPILYLPAAQFPQRTLTVVVRPRDALPVARLIEEHVRALDPGQPVYDARTMQGWVDRSTAQPRFSLLMLSVFAAAALTLAAAGIYGVMAFTVAGRARELGIRVALGADPRVLMRVVIGRGLLLAMAGLALGLGGAVLASRYLASLLYGVQPLDPLVYAGAAAALGAVALVACALPARRILQLDPTAALRAE
jgi:putative ABC transport system permease protein